jgi:hypothetical protein
MNSFVRLSPSAACQTWPEMRPVVEEILASELLTRTWAAVASSYDRLHQIDLLSPVATSVLDSHQEARQRALLLLVRGCGLSLEESVALNRLRRQTERWTDMLLGSLAQQDNVSQFAFSAARACEFAADQRAAEGRDGGGQRWPLALASMRSAYRTSLMDACPNRDLNERIGGSILACCHSELLAASRVLQSRWLLRLNQIADDTEGLLADLLRVEGISADRHSASC